MSVIGNASVKRVLVDGGVSMDILFHEARIEAIIRFDDNDLEGVKFPHDDSLVIMSVIGNASVKRFLVDGGVSMDILFHEAFIKMGYNDSQFTPSNMPVYSFNEIDTKVEGVIQLPMTMRQEPCEVTQMLKFLVIKVVTSYNAILGRTGINYFQAVASTYHLKIKFPTKNGIVMEKEDQKLARSCYIAALRADGIGGQVLPIEDIKYKPQTAIKAHELVDFVVECTIANQEVGGMKI